MKYSWFLPSLVIFVLLCLFLIWSKIHPYQDSLSALIGIWEGFAEINPGIVDPGFVIFKNGGYDGQFFYFLAKSLFSDLNWDLIVDSYFFRLHRIGFTLLIGIPSALFGFEYYPFVATSIPFAIFLFSVYILYSLLPNEQKWLSLFYLFSPYSLNSHLLLVADGFFTSLILIIIYFFKKKSNPILILVLVTIAIFTRELGVFLALAICLHYFSEKKYKLTIAYCIPILFFSIFLFWTRTFSPTHLGTNPLGFGDMIDYPLFGFIKSFFDNGEFHLSPKESMKILFFVQWVALVLYILFFLWNKSFQTKRDFLHEKNKLILFLPILASLGIIFIAEEGYWRSFDNLSRMFTLSLPLVILLQAEKKSKYLSFFLYSSFFLFLFLIIRITIITQTKVYYISP